MAQVEAASWLSVVVRSGPVRTVVNGTLVARSPRMIPVSGCAVRSTLAVGEAILGDQPLRGQAAKAARQLGLTSSL